MKINESINQREYTTKYSRTKDKFCAVFTKKGHRTICKVAPFVEEWSNSLIAKGYKLTWMPWRLKGTRVIKKRRNLDDE